MDDDAFGFDLSQVPEPPPYQPDLSLIGDMQKPDRVERERRARRRGERRDRWLHPFRRQHTS